MPILHVLSGLHAAGIEALALQVIAHAPAHASQELLNLDARAQEIATEVEALQARGRLQRLHQWLPGDGPLLAWRSFRLCRRRRIDAVLFYPCKRPLLWVALGARLAGVRRMAVHVGNTAPADAAGRRLWQRLLRWFQRFGVLAVPCSEAIVASLRPLPADLRLGPVIANGCDTAAIATAAATARALRPADDARRIVMVARLDPIKDQATLIRAFAAARKPGWQLLLVGEGPLRPGLEELARTLDLDPATVLPGRSSAIAELLGQADLFAFSTTAAEGFGIALIEALAAGLPVIASDVPACREVLAGGDAGDLLPAGDAPAWSQRLAELMASADQRRQLAARARSHASHHDIHTTARRWFQLLGA